MRTEARRKNLLILILHYLTQEGYVISRVYGDASPLRPFKSRDYIVLLEQVYIYRKMSRKYSESLYIPSPHLFPILLLLLIIFYLHCWQWIPGKHSTIELQPSPLLLTSQINVVNLL